MVAQQFDRARPVGDVESERDAGVGALEASHQARQYVRADRCRGHDAQRAALQALDLVEGARGLGHAQEDRRGMLLEFVSRVGEVDTAAALFEEMLAERGFEVTDARLDRGLADVQRLGRPREAAVIGHRDEKLQLVQIHDPSRYSIYTIKVEHYCPLLL